MIYSLSWPLALLILTVGGLSAALGWMIRAEVERKNTAGKKTKGTERVK